MRTDVVLETAAIRMLDPADLRRNRNLHDFDYDPHVRTPIALALILICTVDPTRADGLSAGGGYDCGGDAFSSATVVEQRAPRRGPLTATPETLCADLQPQQPQPNINIYVDPFLGPRDGTGSDPDPYGGRPSRPGRF